MENLLRILFAAYGKSAICDSPAQHRGKVFLNAGFHSDFGFGLIAGQKHGVADFVFN
ncbi:hypothetical protein [Hwanghaeella sp. 1Z406]|uniref:hypothetical protein n=1 Tax=Hwanghaeella sp. 1Z406 TaxID=3402811 RepID=UPI003B66C407